MQFKKSLIITVLGLSILGFSTGASAANNDGLVDSEVTQSNKQADNTNLISGRAAKPSNSSRIDVYKPLLGKTYAVAKSSSTVKEDYIYAKARTFNGDGALIKSNSTSAKKQPILVLELIMELFTLVMIGPLGITRISLKDLKILIMKQRHIGN